MFIVDKVQLARHHMLKAELAQTHVVLLEVKGLYIASGQSNKSRQTQLASLEFMLANLQMLMSAELSEQQRMEIAIVTTDELLCLCLEELGNSQKD